jgi:hypothetical protein
MDLFVGNRKPFDHLKQSREFAFEMIYLKENTIVGNVKNNLTEHWVCRIFIGFKWLDRSSQAHHQTIPLLCIYNVAE